MSCTACSKRRTGRIVPVKPTTKKQPQGRTAIEKGNTLRSKLRFTGR